jgi:hypothetical protein
MIIKKIFNKEFDEEVHSDFLKFGKGEFQDKYLIEAKKQKDKWVIKTGPEFANHLVRRLLTGFSGNLSVSGVVVSTLEMDIPYSDGKKQFMGIKQYKVNGDVNAEDILNSMENFPRAFFALSFSVNGNELKIKPKAPKSAKPSTSDKQARAEFCSLKTSNPEIIKEIFFDCPDFKEISIRHTIKIDQMIYPKDFANMKPEDVRAQSKRKGIIVRNILIDGRRDIRESEFLA